MLNSSLIKILRVFNTEELKKFKDFINSPYHNKKTGAVQLYEGIEKYAPGFKHNDLERGQMWKIIFPEKEFNYGIMKNLIYDLTKLAENFISIEQYRLNELQNNFDLLGFLYDKDEKEMFESKFSNIEKTFKKTGKDKDLVREDFYYYLWRYYKMKWNFDNQLSHVKNYERVINQTSDYFLAFFFIHCFIMYLNIEAQSLDHNYKTSKSSLEIFLKKAGSENLITDAIKSISARSVEVSGVLNVYHKMFNSLTDKESLNKYFNFKKSIKENSGLFSKKDLTALYITLLNCKVHLKSTELNNDEEILSIYDLMIKDKIFLSEKEILWDQDFVSYITSAANSGKAEAIENFIKKIINKLQSDTKDNMLKFANAHLYFTRGEFNKSLECTLQINYDLFPMKYYIKNLQIRNHYELNDYDSFLLAFDSYKHFLNKNKFVGERWKEAMLVFCNRINRLFKLKESFDEYEFKKIKAEVFSGISNRNTWLARKIIELEKFV